MTLDKTEIKRTNPRELSEDNLFHLLNCPSMQYAVHGRDCFVERVIAQYYVTK